MVLKETYLVEKRWKNLTFWSSPQKNVPREAAIQGWFSGLKDSTNIVQLYSAKVYEAKRMYRLYMEYCEHGDLEQMLNNHVNLAEQAPRSADGELIEW